MTGADGERAISRLRAGLHPRALKDALRVCWDIARGRGGVRRAFAGLRSDVATVDIAAHAPWFIRAFTDQEAASFVDAVARGDLVAAMAVLERVALGQTPDAPDRVHVAAQARANLTFLRDGWAPEPSVSAAAPPEERRSLLVFHSRGPLVNNGYAARSLEVLGAVRDAGWEASSVTRLGYPNDLTRLAEAQTPLEEGFGGFPCRALLDDGEGLRWRALDDYLQAYSDRLVKEIERTRPAVVHAASNHMNGLAAINAGRRTGVASVYEARGLWELTALSQGRYGREDARFRLAARMEAAAAKHADRVVALSDGIKAELVARGARADRIHVIPNSVDVDGLARDTASPEMFAPLGLRPDRVTVGYAGAFAAYEGLEVLIEALARAPSTQGLIIGGGEREAVLKRLAAGAGLSERLVLTGRLSRQEAASSIKLADIVVLARRDTPVTRIVPPIKAAEAMARGQALIVSDLPALREIVTHEETGLVVPAGNAEALAQAMMRLADDEALRRRLARNAQAVARERFSLAVAGKAFNDCYEQAIEAARRR